jgi:hypothetical protein
MKQRIQPLINFQINESDTNADIKKNCIERLAGFFRVNPYNLSNFKFDGSDDIKKLSAALSSTSDKGTKLYYDTAIKLAKEDLGLDEDKIYEVSSASKFYIIRKSTNRPGGLFNILGQLSIQDVNLYKNHPIRGSVDVFAYKSEDEMMKAAEEFRDKYGKYQIMDGRGAKPLQSRRPDNSKPYFSFNQEDGNFEW